MQASCKQNINGSFQVLRPINFVHVVHQIGGVLYEPPTTKHGGSSSSTLVMTTSLRNKHINSALFDLICDEDNAVSVDAKYY